MNMEKIKKWVDFSNQFHQRDDWKKFFNLYPPDQFFSEKGPFPKYDIFQNETHNCLLIEVPGLNREDFHVSLQSKSKLLLKGTAKPIFPAEMEMKKERFYGEFERVIDLPEPAEPHLMQFYFHQGLLQIIYPRQNESVHLNLY